MNEPDDCDCCEGLSVKTPAAHDNPQGLSAVSYRVGTHGSFKQSLLARLSSSDFPALASLRTRQDEDWTIGLCDAFATMADVFTFYQERIANETWLRTAVERRSVLEMARLVGYQLAPGLAANTPLAFTLDQPLTPVAPAPLPVTVPVGTRVQSVPAADESAQTFETIEAIVARAEWNALSVQTSLYQAPSLGQRALWLQGTATQLQAGDAILLVGTAREKKPGSEAWDVRWIDSVSVDVTRGLTCVRWRHPLGSFQPHSEPATDGVRVHAFRQRAALFGHNAPDANLMNFSQMPAAQQAAVVSKDASGVLSWKGYDTALSQDQLDLDAVYPKIVHQSWIALAGGSGGQQSMGYVELYRVTGTAQVSLAAFGLSGKVSRLSLDTDENLDLFGRRQAWVLAQSEELSLAERPLLYPLFGDTLALASVQPLLAPGQRLAVRGRRQRVNVPADPQGVSFPDDAGRRAIPGESFMVMAAPQALQGTVLMTITPEDLDTGADLQKRLRWRVQDHDGRTISIDARVGALQLEAARTDDPFVDEVVAVALTPDAITHGHERSVLKLQSPLTQCFDRWSVSINANVAMASHGETVGEVSGSGDAAQTGQRIALRQAPLTQVPASNPQGRQAELQVYVNDLLWQEVPSLYEQPPGARVYAVRQNDDGQTSLQFGDGIEGARLPSGTNNLRAGYRKGLGLIGNVRAGTLSTLLSRPLGVKSANNPLPASGGEDPQTLDAARRNAPTTVLTLDRAVSITDYADFARTFAGIDKATAIWIDGGVARGVHLTVAGAGGRAVPPGSLTHKALLSALRAYGDALLPLTLNSYDSVNFALKARVRVAGDALPDLVLAAVDATLRQAFAFDARDFGQAVALSDITAVVHGVAGVEAVDIDALHRLDELPGALPPERLHPRPALIKPDGSVSAAELLTLAPQGLALSLWS